MGQEAMEATHQAAQEVAAQGQMIELVDLTNAPEPYRVVFHFEDGFIAWIQTMGTSFEDALARAIPLQREHIARANEVVRIEVRSIDGTTLVLGVKQRTQQMP